MTRDQIFERLTGLFREVFANDTITPTETMAAHDVAEWDSLSHIRLIVTIEREFDVRFDTAEVYSAENVGEFVDLILSKL